MGSINKQPLLNIFTGINSSRYQQKSLLLRTLQLNQS